MENVVIVSAVRTPIGSLSGELSHLSAPTLGAAVIGEVLKRADIDGKDVSEVMMGCVLTAGVGQAPARQASLAAGIPNTVPCVTIGKVCGSGLKTVGLAAQSIRAGDNQIVVAGGMENMSLTPHLLEKSRQGYRLGHQPISDSMVKDGLWDVYHQFHMGNAAELCAQKYKFSRLEQDQYAMESYRRAVEAQTTGKFTAEILPFKKGNLIITEDEEPRRYDPQKLAHLKPAFMTDGTITAANASKINDGAAAVLLMSEREAKARGVKPLAKVVAYAEASQAPEWFTTAPVMAIKNVLKKAKLSISDIDLFEINEAFSAVAMAVIQELNLDSSKVNVHGGAVALGHPIGASGARILTTLLYAMKDRGASPCGARLGLASLCIGGGEANAIIVEAINPYK